MTHSRNAVPAIAAGIFMMAGCQTAGAPADQSVPAKHQSARPAPSHSDGPSVLKSRSDRPPPQATLVIEVTDDKLVVDGEPFARLDGGYVDSDQFVKKDRFAVKELAGLIADKLTANRRQRLVEGRQASETHVVVQVDPSVPVDTLMALQHTFAATDLNGLTFRVGKRDEVHVRIRAGFIGRRRVPWRDRKPTDPVKSRHGDDGDDRANGRDRHVDHGFRRVESAGALKAMFARSADGQQGGKEASVRKGPSRVTDGKTKGPASSSRGVNRVGRLSVAGPIDKKAQKNREILGALGLEEGELLSKSSSNKLLASNLAPSDEVCRASADQAHEPIALTHATVRLTPVFAKAWLSTRSREQVKYLYHIWSPDRGPIDHIDDVPWWRMYNALAAMPRQYAEADTLIISPHPALPSQFVVAADRVNCRLPKASYPSSKAWQQARAAVDDCEPIFADQLLGNGARPTKKPQ